MKALRMSLILNCLLAILFMVVGCGKKTDSSSPPAVAMDPAVQPATSETEEYLAKQKIVCEVGEVCPNYIVKIVVFDNHKTPRTCTGFLVNDSTVATSTSCLPQLLRLKDQDCSTDVTFFFPETNAREAERVGCAKVLQVSDLGNKEGAIWRDDVAFLKLSQAMIARRSLEFNREGLENHKAYTYWGLDQVDDKTSLIRRHKCEAIHSSWVNPLASKHTSPKMVFADCELKNGNTGAPILDERGQVRGMVSQMMDIKDREYLESTGLLTQKLKPMFHATNFSCAPTIFDSTTQDERECSKVINQSELETSRRNMMLEREDFFEEKRRQLEEKLSLESPYFNFSVILVDKDNSKNAVITPKCFRDVEKWIRTVPRGNHQFKMSFPQLALKRTMDAEGRFGAVEIDNGKIDYTSQFSVKMLKNQGYSDVYLWNANTDLTFKKITICK